MSGKHGFYGDIYVSSDQLNQVSNYNILLDSSLAGTDPGPRIVLRDISGVNYQLYDTHTIANVNTLDYIISYTQSETVGTSVDLLKFHGSLGLAIPLLKTYTPLSTDRIVVSNTDGELTSLLLNPNTLLGRAGTTLSSIIIGNGLQLNGATLSADVTTPVFTDGYDINAANITAPGIYTDTGSTESILVFNVSATTTSTLFTVNTLTGVSYAIGLFGVGRNTLGTGSVIIDNAYLIINTSGTIQPITCLYSHVCGLLTITITPTISSASVNFIITASSAAKYSLTLTINRIS